MPKIVHVIIAAFYKEGWGYQENILPHKHKELGYDAYIIAWTPNNYKLIEYVNTDGVKVTILPLCDNFLTRIPKVRGLIPHNKVKGLYKKLCEVAPDIIFVHGADCYDNLEVVRYIKKHTKTQLFVDQHADYYNSPNIDFRKKTLGRYIVNSLARYARKMWGVTPWRVKYLQDVYHVNPSKTGLLVMGGDENKIKWNNRNEIRKRIRNKYGIPENAFLVISGGKIDKPKNIHLLIDVIEKMSDNNVFLLLFGKFETDMQEYEGKVQNKCNIVNIGWVASDATYDLFLSSDLGCFPGTHSVLWEQACASGLPCVFKDWNGGFNHVDVGGNCIILKEVTHFTLRDSILTMIDNKNKFCQMKHIAETQARTHFSYIEIAKRSIMIENN